MQARSNPDQLDYTRTHEQRGGSHRLRYPAQVGIQQPRDAGVPEPLQTATRLLEGQYAGLSAHPPLSPANESPTSRTACRNSPTAGPDSLDFQLVRTKLIARKKTTQDAIAYFSDALGAQKHGNPIAQRYGLIISLLPQP